MKTMTIPRGNHLLRIALMTPANFGSVGGSAAIDRPLSLDPWTLLNYVPESIAKGVIAGAAFGNRERDGIVNKKRKSVFGSGDDNRDGKPFDAGAPARVIFGDGELLAFPAPGRDGTPVMVFPAVTLRRLALLPLTAPLPLEPVSLESFQCFGQCPDAALPAAVASTSTVVYEGIVPPLLADSATDQPWLVAGDELAATLWQSAVEIRTQTSIDPQRKRVRAGTLRKIELAPAGTVFVSLVTNDDDAEIAFDLPSQLQLGAWEGTGAGFVDLQWLRPDASASKATYERIGAGVSASADAKILIEAHRAIAACAQQSFAGMARTLIREFGSRWRTQGLPMTLAFSLGKARCLADLDKRAAPERLAHRWLLRTLLSPQRQSPYGTLADLHEITVETISGDRDEPQDLTRRVTALARYADQMLGDRAGSAL